MSNTLDESDALSVEGERRLLRLTIVVAAVLVIVLAAVSFAIWPRNDKGALEWKSGQNFAIMFVPISILEWSFAGAMVSVLYRLAYRKRIRQVGFELYTWAVAKPVIGLFMGGLVYFVALAGARLLESSSNALADALWLNVAAFVGGFSDELSVGVINRFVRGRLGVGKTSGDAP